MATPAADGSRRARSAPAEEDGLGRLSVGEVAANAGVSAGTVRRWVAAGLVPGFDGEWTEGNNAWVRVIARLRDRGHSLAEIRRAIEEGRLVTGPVEYLLQPRRGHHTLREAAKLAGIDERLARELFSAMGLTDRMGTLNDEDVQMLSYATTVLEAGFPRSALMELMRVYGQKIAQIADAEVRLIHLYVHEPMIRGGFASAEIADELVGLTAEVLPLAMPVMNYLHARLLADFVELDTLGHMEAELSGVPSEAGRLRVAIAFADLAGYSRLTVERGDDAALAAVERFVAVAEDVLPIDARVTKTLGDEVMVIGSDPVALAEWAVEVQRALGARPPRPRIGIHYGEAVYRDGDYYGREVNQAARVVARASGGEVLATRVVAQAAEGIGGLSFERIGEVGLKGFSEPTEIFRITGAEE
ncbi:MAG TPA: adenylate cyclase regulatory domain-containing protein [Solirubrobacteraceae bacterium]|nr:adenylate cyclase regulatory domain-containing protein [Solirubrobacteraceae bacterium]